MISTPLRTALALMTRLPSGLKQPPNDRDQGLAVACYPLVGLIVGLLLWLGAAAGGWLHWQSAPLAILLVTAWVLITGALHLDGLADSADAWLGGYGDRERTLRIMKDPASGPAGVCAVVLVLLGKTLALWTLLDLGWSLALLLAPVLARAAGASLFLLLPYARPEGLGRAGADHLPRDKVTVALALTALLAVLLGGLAGAAWVLISALITWAAVRLLRQRLGGFTGDTAGALIEVVETLVLLAAALVL
ncbi:cobalamin-5'-phosphate synthase [Alloalcanivorax xenomutans]|uniref:adenosylcobinamide-GDP ribazoletransferase n=1 Tax=Alloalcanivorax xenomutans TaxID=1094342 RepID=UPI000BCC254F|nr:adenosylcobinamide-GDP ribazoletransferase [Alloalcanivorax xenomutans]SOB95598.1 cobalamin-5'-phosphate synthase [Alloalcanivorax xenomutans]